MRKVQVFLYFTLLCSLVSSERVISVEGKASKTLNSEKTNVRLTLMTQRNNANEALTESNKVLSNFQQKLSSEESLKGKYTIFDEDFQLSQQYSYQRDNNKRVFDGFRVTRTLLVQVLDPKLAGKVIDKAFISSPTQDEHNTIELNSVSPHVSASTKESEKIKLLEACAVNAKAKALTLATALGHQLGGIAKASLNERGDISFKNSFKKSFIAMSEMNDVEADTEMQNQGVTLEVSCDVDFEIAGSHQDKIKELKNSLDYNLFLKQISISHLESELID